MATDLNLQINFTGKNALGPVTPVGFSVPIMGQAAYDRIEVPVPASGSPLTVPIPPIGSVQSFFMLVSDIPVGVQLNAETALSPGAAVGVLPAVVLRTGGPPITSVTITPNGQQAATVTIHVAGK